MKIKRAYLIPDQITMGIFKLPCVVGVRKIENKPVFELAYGVHDIDGEDVYYVPSGQWLCELNCGDWVVLDDEDYRKIKEES